MGNDRRRNNFSFGSESQRRTQYRSFPQIIACREKETAQRHRHLLSVDQFWRWSMGARIPCFWRAAGKTQRWQFDIIALGHFIPAPARISTESNRNSWANFTREDWRTFGPPDQSRELYGTEIRCWTNTNHQGQKIRGVLTTSIKISGWIKPGCLREGVWGRRSLIMLWIITSCWRSKCT